jgi:hypothetical protein
MPKLFDMQATVDMIQTLACVAVVIQALQVLVERKQYGTSGIYSYAVLKKSFSWMTQGWKGSVLNRLCESPTYLLFIALQLTAAVLVISHLFPFFSGCFILMILLVHLLSCLRHKGGLDGAQQMQTIIFASLLLFYLSSDPLAKTDCLLFIGLQVLLAYLTAGVVKVKSSVWRSGTALGNILQRTRFRNEKVSHIVRKHPFLTKVVCWSVFTGECLFPLLVLAGTQSCLLVLVAGILFHLIIALVWGLNSFFWSFVAAYPAVLFLANTFQIAIHSHLKY